MRTVAILTAAGLGSRMKSKVKKQFLEVSNKPILYWTLKVFHESDAIDDIILVVPRGDVVKTRDRIVDKYGFSKVAKVITGGKRRQDSVIKGFEAIEGYCDVVCIHDGVRPLIQAPLIKKAVQTAHRFGAACVAVRVKDTIKQITDDGFVKWTPNRRYLYAAQTPQAFEYNLYSDAVANAKAQQIDVTDDSQMVEAIGGRVVIVEGAYENIKITTPSDLLVAGKILKERSAKK